MICLGPPPLSLDAALFQLNPNAVFQRPLRALLHLPCSKSFQLSRDRRSLLRKRVLKEKKSRGSSSSATPKAGATLVCTLVAERGVPALRLPLTLDSTTPSTLTNLLTRLLPPCMIVAYLSCVL